MRSERTAGSTDFCPEVTLLIAAYNEIKNVPVKISNTAQLDYPPEKLKVIWITDGSDDGTPELLKQHPGHLVLHQQERAGKTAALNRAMKYVTTPFVVFCDANTLLDRMALRRLMVHFSDTRVGCVAGEKRISRNKANNAAGSGEGAYWQYESLIKQLESRLYSTLAAAGELYAIRSNLYTEADPDSIIDDFVISVKIAMSGFRIKYAPDAFTLESPSVNIHEELKRKIRIASGGFQTIIRFPGMLNILRYGLLSFEFISHKALRWLLVPVCIPAILILNGIICFQQYPDFSLYSVVLLLQGIFYAFVILGFAIEKQPLRFRIFFLPYYLIIMNYAQMAGIVRYISKKQTVVWEKSLRA